MHVINDKTVIIRIGEIELFNKECNTDDRMSGGDVHVKTVQVSILYPDCLQQTTVDSIVQTRSKYPFVCIPTAGLRQISDPYFHYKSPVRAKRDLEMRR